jgi:LysR family transcriptional regulator, hydrogen peroxide-inducible genes activator
MITLRHLRYFDALAAARHFGRAAERVGISQPALSMQIRELEAAFGEPLFQRSAAGASLTDLGQEVAARTSGILAAVRDLDELIEARRETLSGSLRVGVIPSIAPYLLPSLLKLAAKKYPGLRLTVRETVTRALADELIRGEIDAMVASVPLGLGDFAEEAAFSDPFLLAAPAGSARAGRSPALAELIDTDELLLLEDGHCLRDQALAVCKAIDPRRLRSFGATSLSTLLELVAAGQGVTFVPQLALSAGVVQDRRLSFIRFAAPEPHRAVGLVWRRTSPRERDYRAFVELVRLAAEEAGARALGF